MRVSPGLIGILCMLAGCNPSPSSGPRDEAPAAATAPRAARAAQDETPVAVVRDYYASIAAHDFGRAYGLWGDRGRASGKSLADFTSGFAQTASVEVEPGAPSAPEGA